MDKAAAAVVGHSGKSFGGGLDALRAELAERGVDEPLWLVVDDGAELGDAARKALDAGADTVLAWGGDGTVQCCVDVLAGTDVALAVMPAGTSNLLAQNLGIPQDIGEAADIPGGRPPAHRHRPRQRRGLRHHGAGGPRRQDHRRRRRRREGRTGRLAYVISAARNADTKPFGARAEVDGTPFFEGRATCVLMGNVGKLFAGLEPFNDAEPDDGSLEIGVVTAEGAFQWLGAALRATFGDVADSPHTTIGEFRRGGSIRFDRAVPYELDGNERGSTDHMELEVSAGALVVCVPRPEGDS